MYPTAGVNDNGQGWKLVDEKTMTWQREVETYPPPIEIRKEYNEVMPGIWVRK